MKLPNYVKMPLFIIMLYVVPFLIFLAIDGINQWKLGIKDSYIRLRANEWDCTMVADGECLEWRKLK